MSASLPHADKLLLSVLDVCKLLSLSESTVRKMAKAGAIPSRRVGCRLLFPRVEVVNWIAAGCPRAEKGGAQ